MKLPGKNTIWFAALWIIYTLLVLRFWFVTDDAFITFRYAHNWADGAGIRFNLGEHTPVEGYSNFLWVAICAVIELIGAQIKLWPLVISYICGSLLLWRVYITLLNRFNLGLPVTVIATLFMAASPSYALWSTSGMETMPFALLMFLAFEYLVLSEKPASPVITGLIGLALALMRVEGVFWALLIGILALVSMRLSHRKNFRGIIYYFIILIVGFGIYWIWRYSYYGAFLPNTIYAKVAISPAVIKRGINYVIEQYLTFIPLFLNIPGLIASFRPKRMALGLPVALVVISVTAFAVAVGGDFMAMGRLLVPALPFSAIMLGWFLGDVLRPAGNKKSITSIIVVLVILAGILPAFNLHVVPNSIRAKFHFRYNLRYYHSEYTQWRIQKDHATEWEIVGRTLKTISDPSDSVVSGIIGALGYYSELYVYDRNGLIDTEIARHKVSGPLSSPGHDKRVEREYFLNREPTFIFIILMPESDLAQSVEDSYRNEISDRYTASWQTVDYWKNGEQYYLFLMRRINPGS